jgi:protein-S-isoprenylcysteine O-methyltransferase Ste14
MLAFVRRCRPSDCGYARVMTSDLDPVTEWAMLACWLCFLGVWLTGWLYNLRCAPKIERRRLSPVVLLGAVLAWGISASIPEPVWDVMTVNAVAVRQAGVLLLIVGTALAVWGRVALGTMWTGAPAQRARHKLCTAGPFAIVRHPIYLGVLAMLAGTAAVYGFGSWTGPVVAAAIGLGLKIRVEERLMLETFGREYEAYRRRVRGLLPLPHLRPAQGWPEGPGLTSASWNVPRFALWSSSRSSRK